MPNLCLRAGAGVGHTSAASAASVFANRHASPAGASDDCIRPPPGFRRATALATFAIVPIRVRAVYGRPLSPSSRRRPGCSSPEQAIASSPVSDVIPAELPDELRCWHVASSEHVGGDKVSRELEPLMAEPVVPVYDREGQRCVRAERVALSGRSLELRSVGEESRADGTLADVRRVRPFVPRQRYSPLVGSSRWIAAVVNGDQSVHSCPHQLAPRTSSPRGEIGAIPGGCESSGSSVGPPRNRLPAATSRALLAEDMRYPAGMRPKLSVGECPCSWRWSRRPRGPSAKGSARPPGRTRPRAARRPAAAPTRYLDPRCAGRGTASARRRRP